MLTLLVILQGRSQSVGVYLLKVENVGVYSLNWDNGYFYIGQSQNLKNRWIDHKKLANSGKLLTKQPKLGRIWRKYGEPEFRVIQNCHIEQLNSLEQYFIDVYWGNKLMCNTSPSSRNNRGVKKTKPSHNKGKKMSQAQKDKISKRRIGRYAKEHHPRNKFTVEQASDIIKMNKEGLSGAEIARRLKVSKSLICNILSGNHWTVK